MIGAVSSLAPAGGPGDVPLGGGNRPPVGQDAVVAHEFQVMLVKQMLSDLKLPGMDGQAATFSSLIEEAFARQIVDAQEHGRDATPLPGHQGRTLPSPNRPPADGVSGLARRTSGYGWRADPLHEHGPRFHDGIDLAAPTGTPIVANRGGTVVRAGPSGGYGNLVVIDHGDGTESRYGHCSAIDVVVGQAVGAGEAIARVGSTGRSTGPHLHFEVRKGGVTVDPAPYLIESQGSVPPIREETTTLLPPGRP